MNLKDEKITINPRTLKNHRNSKNQRTQKIENEKLKYETVNEFEKILENKKNSKISRGTKERC